MIPSAATSTILAFQARQRSLEASVAAERRRATRIAAEAQAALASAQTERDDARRIACDAIVAADPSMTVNDAAEANGWFDLYASPSLP